MPAAVLWLLFLLLFLLASFHSYLRRYSMFLLYFFLWMHVGGVSPAINPLNFPPPRTFIVALCLCLLWKYFNYLSNWHNAQFWLQFAIVWLSNENNNCRRPGMLSAIWRDTYVISIGFSPSTRFMENIIYDQHLSSYRWCSWNCCVERKSFVIDL